MKLQEITMRTCRYSLLMALTLAMMTGCASKQPITRTTVIVPHVGQIPELKKPETGPIKGYKRLKPGRQTIPVGRRGGYYFGASEFDYLNYRDKLKNHYTRALEQQIQTHNKAVERWQEQSKALWNSENNN